MANPTYTLISTQTVGAGGAASVTFSSIPQTYTDLKLICSSRLTAGGPIYDTISINGSTSTFSYRTLEGNGATTSSSNGSTGASGVSDPASYTASTFSNIEIYIPNYAGSTNKSYSVDSVTENNATTSYADFIAGLWATTSAITSITYAAGANNLAQYSSFYLYGITRQ